jgi:glycosyltransferase involved in cell wall biosynthesis
MKLGVAIDETWAFFHEVYEELSSHHPTRMLKQRQSRLPFLAGRMTELLRRRDLDAFLGASDVVFFEWASGLLAAATARPKACGIVTRLHRYEMYRWLDRVAWDRVDRVILVSEAKRREFASRLPAHAEKAVVIPEAISLDRFRPSERPFRGDLGVLCNLSPRKRIYEIVLAFAELARGRAGLHLHVGGGPHPAFPEYEAVVKALVQSLGLDDRITFYGHVADPEEWYRRIDVFLSNSYSEGLQVAPMEAIASGRYCLSHHWDGADELLPPEDLFYAEGELVRKLGDYCDAGERERKARQERQLAIVRERFDVAKTKVLIRQVVEEVASSQDGRR